MKNQDKALTDIEKLSILLPHWLHHNNDHIRDQEKWVKAAEDAGFTKVADELRRAIGFFKRANRHLEKADLCLKVKIADAP
ncbi:MAG: hypothetical protein AB1427_05870 [Thermodesulfobacteriota bacterium]